MSIAKLISGVDVDDLNASKGSDVANAVNALIDVTTGIEPVEAITLKGLPQTAGAPAGHGDLAQAVNQSFAAKNSQTAILFGSSSTEGQNFPPLGDTLALSQYRFILPRLGDSVRVVKNAGKSGNTAQMMLDRINQDVLAYDSEWVFINGGINDIWGEGFSAEVTFSVMSQIVNILLADGRKLILFNCPAQMSTRSGFTVGKSMECAKYNNLLSSFVRPKSGVILIDMYSQLVDWSSADSSGLPQCFSADGLHLSTYGTMLISDEFVRRTVGIFTPSLSLFTPIVDAGLLGSKSSLIGTSGTNGLRSSGQVATGCQSLVVSGANGTIAASKLPLRGQRQTVTLIAGNGEVRTRLFIEALSEIQAVTGKTFSTKILCRLRTLSGTAILKSFVLRLTANNPAVNQAVNGDVSTGFPATIDSTFDTGLILINLRDFTIPSGVTLGGCYIETRLDSVAGGVVELDIYGVEIREVIT